ncbi:hypothetical protein PAHAL_6G090500 [Panicum hallii]|uniref:Uncharacterized protein n=1 Tax=Panicum hallii TaxID=206008 RepID=A0A2T8IFR1_9POAL|nr:hypothetical protein PAHAL_6G090500 [Panicum hallii]
MRSPSSKPALQPYPHHCARHQDFCRCSASAAICPTPPPSSTSPCPALPRPLIPRAASPRRTTSTGSSPSLLPQLQWTQASRHFLLVLLFPPRTATSSCLHPKPKLHHPAPPSRSCAVPALPQTGFAPSPRPSRPEQSAPLMLHFPTAETLLLALLLTL